MFNDQISGELDIAKDALVQVVMRLRANLFDREGSLPTMLPVLPYLPVSEGSEGLNYDSRDSKRHGRGRSYSGGYGPPSDIGPSDGYGGGYGGSQVSFCLIADATLFLSTVEQIQHFLFCFTFTYTHLYHCEGFFNEFALLFFASLKQIIGDADW